LAENGQESRPLTAFLNRFLAQKGLGRPSGKSLAVISSDFRHSFFGMDLRSRRDFWDIKKITKTWWFVEIIEELSDYW
jgi:hypothetical protein